MQWAKTRPKVKYDLALSGILDLPFAELEAKIEDFDLNGDNSYGYARWLMRWHRILGWLPKPLLPSPAARRWRTIWPWPRRWNTVTRF